MYQSVIIDHRTILAPRFLNKNLRHNIVRQIERELNGTYMMPHGIVKNNSVKVLESTIGRICGPHFTGGVTYTSKVACDVCMPYKGLVLKGVDVVKYNDMILIASTGPLEIVIAKDQSGNNLEVFKEIGIGSRISIEILDVSFSYQSQKYIAVGKLLEKNMIEYFFPLPDVGRWNISDNVNIIKGSLNLPIESENLRNIESKIDEMASQWEIYRNFNNPLEMVSNVSYTGGEIPQVGPIVSRSYYVIRELIMDIERRLGIKLLPNKSLNMLFLAEGPGGFMQSVYDIRKEARQSDSTIIDQFYGITKPKTETDKAVLDWKYKSRDGTTLRKMFSPDDHANLTLEHANLYSDKTIQNIRSSVDIFGGNKADLIIADGGVDVGKDYHWKELMNQKLIMSEIVGAVGRQAIGGSFVVKFYGMFSPTTIQMIKFLGAHYERISILKPQTSKPVNTEKYIICYNFVKGVDDEDFNALVKVLDIMPTTIRRGTNKVGVTNLFDFGTDDIWDRKMREVNNYFMSKQIDFINTSIQMESFVNNKSYKALDDIRSEQKSNAIKFCVQYGIPYNNTINIQSAEKYISGSAKLTKITPKNRGLVNLFGDNYANWCYPHDKFLTYVTPQKVSIKMAELIYQRYNPKYIWDMFAGIGSDSVHLATKTHAKLITATEIESDVFKCLRKNVKEYLQIKPVQTDNTKYKYKKNKANTVIHYDPPWGDKFRPGKPFDFDQVKLGDDQLPITDIISNLLSQGYKAVIVKSPLLSNTIEDRFSDRIDKDTDVIKFAQNKLKYIIIDNTPTPTSEGVEESKTRSDTDTDTDTDSIEVDEEIPNVEDIEDISESKDAKKARRKAERTAKKALRKSTAGSG